MRTKKSIKKLCNTCKNEKAELIIISKELLSKEYLKVSSSFKYKTDEAMINPFIIT